MNGRVLCFGNIYGAYQEIKRGNVWGITMQANRRYFLLAHPIRRSMRPIDTIRAWKKVSFSLSLLPSRILGLPGQGIMIGLLTILQAVTRQGIHHLEDVSPEITPYSSIQCGVFAHAKWGLDGSTANRNDVMPRESKNVKYAPWNNEVFCRIDSNATLFQGFLFLFDRERDYFQDFTLDLVPLDLDGKKLNWFPRIYTNLLCKKTISNAYMIYISLLFAFHIESHTLDHMEYKEFRKRKVKGMTSYD